jgi:putative endonuclease
LVYLPASRKHGTLYIDVTNDLRRRVDEHISGQGAEFTRKHGVQR